MCGIFNDTRTSIAKCRLHHAICLLSLLSLKLLKQKSKNDLKIDSIIFESVLKMIWIKINNSIELFKNLTNDAGLTRGILHPVVGTNSFCSGISRPLIATLLRDVCEGCRRSSLCSHVSFLPLTLSLFLFSLSLSLPLVGVLASDSLVVSCCAYPREPN